MDKVVRLCESAIEKGLDKNETAQATRLASATLYEFASQLSARTFAIPRDRRWQLYRSQAIPRLKKAIEFDDQLVDAYILLAKFEALDRRKQKDAAKTIEKAIELAVDDRAQLSEALVVRAKLASDDEAKIADLNQAIKIDPDNNEAYQMRGLVLIASGKAEEAVADLTKWLNTQPKNFRERVLVARQIAGMDKLEDDTLKKTALKLLDEAAQIRPESAIPASIKGRIYLANQEFQKAIDAATQAIELEKNQPEPYSTRALARAALKDFDGAVEDADSLIKLQWMAGYRLRSRLYLQQEKFDAAIVDVQAMASRDPGNRNLQAELAMLYSVNLQPEEAIKVHTKLLRDVSASKWADQPESVQITFMVQRMDLLSKRGDARLATGEHEKAVQDYDESLELFDKVSKLVPEDRRDKLVRDSALLNNFAWVLSTSPEDKVRDGKRAIELATESAELTEYKAPHILSTLAAAYAETGDFEKAIELIEQGIEVNEAAAAGAEDKARFERQRKSLNDELESYQSQEPWREKQDPEEDRRERDEALAKKSAEENDSGEETPDDKGDSEDDAANEEMEDSKDEAKPDSTDQESDDDENKKTSPPAAEKPANGDSQPEEDQPENEVDDEDV